MAGAELYNDLYVTDNYHHRIMRFNYNTTDITGWIGRIALAPSGGVAGCTALDPYVNPITPGWCLGGSAQGGSAPLGGVDTANDMAIDGNDLYYLSSNSCLISRYNKTTGAFYGWMGGVVTTPTGGDPGCTK